MHRFLSKRPCIIFNFNRLHNFKNTTNPNLKILQKNIVLTPRRFSSHVCWKCGVERKHATDIFCENCKIIQKPLEKENYFRLFGMEEHFNIDQNFLRDKFRQLQSVLHPDKFTNKTNEEKTISEEYSSLINKAYSDLQSTLKRAEHLLKLKGVEITEDQSIDDPTFLAEIMTLNEEVEEAGNDIEKLKALNEKNKEELKKISHELTENFKNNDSEISKKNIIRMKYFTSISLRINGTLRELGVTD